MKPIDSQDLKNTSRDTAARSEGSRILVVDDEQPMRDLLIMLLTRLGHQGIPAVDGIHALHIASTRTIDAAIVDIVMPRMDGITLTKEFSKRYPGLPVMIITGHADQSSARNAIAAGATDFVTKPFSIAEFSLRFSKMMRDQKVRQQDEARKNHILFQMKQKHSQEVEDLQRQIKSIQYRAWDPYASEDDL